MSVKKSRQKMLVSVKRDIETFDAICHGEKILGTVWKLFYREKLRQKMLVTVKCDIEHLDLTRA